MFFAVTMIFLIVLALFGVALAAGAGIVWRMVQKDEGFEDALLGVMRSMRNVVADMPDEQRDDTSSSA